MIIVNIIGGLGNQMFQYAFYKALLVKGIEVKVDISCFKDYKVHNGYELERIFNINPVKATMQQCYDLGKPRNDIFHKILRKIGFSVKKNSYYEQGAIESFQYIPEKYDFTKNMYLNGYWANPKWFSDIDKDIRNDFTFLNPINDENKRVEEDILNSNSVSLHVRRGDYLKYDIYQGICTIEDYYSKAIRYIRERVENAKFFIFSNDIKYCKNNLSIENIRYISNNVGLNSYKDMYLMTKCKHNIVANSTFSFWGGYLNNNNYKIVICPHKFLNLDYDKEDIFPDNWIKIR